MRALGSVLMLTACRFAFESVDAGTDVAADAAADAYVRVPANRAFVTSAVYPATFTSAAMASTTCQQRADAATLGGTWFAIVGDSTRGPVDPLLGARGWEDLAGNYVADAPAEWLGGGMRRPLRFDENGDDAGYGLVWIGASGNTCTNWSSTAGSGSIATTTNAFGAFDVSSCANTAHIACAEVAKQITLAEPSVAGRLLFVSVEPWVPGGGVASADAHCMTSAANANIAGTFRAVIGIETASVLNRLSDPASGFVSLRGRQLVAPGVDIRTAQYLDAFLVRSDGSDARGEPAAWSWAGFAGLNCMDWTVNTGTGRTGDSSSALIGQVFSRFDYACSDGRPLLCAQD